MCNFFNIKFVSMKCSNLFLFIVLILGFAFACQFQDRGKTDSSDKYKLSEKSAVGSSFDCSPDTLYPGGRFTIYLPTSHHFRELAIEGPRKEFYYLQFAPAILLMPVEEFQKAGKIDIPQDITGLIYLDGKPIKRQVFTETGKYTVIIADNLETEFENSTNISCSVIFISSLKK
jgi:hypothetical protein